METAADLIARVRPVPLMALLQAGGTFAGGHRSPLVGQGIEFAGIRAYVPGDDVRTIDWKVTARRAAPYVREYTEDREMNLYIAIDCSASGGFAGAGQKDRTIIDAAAALVLGAESCGDRVGLCLFSDRMESLVPARRGRRHVAVLLSALLARLPFSGRTDLQTALGALTPSLPPLSTVLIISDFVTPPFTEALKVLGKKHRVVLLRVTDPHEETLPDLGLISLEDAESGEQMIVDTSDPALRRRFSEAAAGHARTLALAAGECRAPLIPLTAGDDLRETLMQERGRR
ncbi:DUF58 domain-containing protein [Methanofollis formosanus]|uniref:DUF58 domain-containing protein n=1 Tax=Methanofollis formosanus TaxID=299308 RepID=A0A8G0ZY97_9EURY|nr:DUF58 domain-containing protein [Methanofollis formosanus]QYZ78499.1 DUF58 domain-containing protein [Methanofollis formosanus]